jgi:hypothetical protein
MERATWLKARITEEEIEGYKVDFKRWFLDIDPPRNSRYGHAVINDPATQPTGEAALWAEMLRQAWMDLHLSEKPSHDQLLQHYRTKEWVLYNGNECGSFNWVCDSLNLDASYMRRKMKETMPAIERKGHRVFKLGGGL